MVPVTWVVLTWAFELGVNDIPGGSPVKRLSEAELALTEDPERSNLIPTNSSPSHTTWLSNPFTVALVVANVEETIVVGWLILSGGFNLKDPVKVSSSQELILPVEFIVKLYMLVLFKVTEGVPEDVSEEKGEPKRYFLILVVYSFPPSPLSLSTS